MDFFVEPELVRLDFVLYNPLYFLIKYFFRGYCVEIFFGCTGSGYFFDECKC